MDKVVTASLGPLDLRIREVLEGLDDRVTVDLPHLHASMLDLSWSIQAVDAFAGAVTGLLAGDEQFATLDLAYFDGDVSTERPSGPTPHDEVAYGLVLTLLATEGDSFRVKATVAPDSSGVVYSVGLDVSRDDVEQLLLQLKPAWD